MNQLYLKIILQSETVNIDDFFSWLGSTESGKQWFIDHKLKRSKHLINELQEDFNSVNLPLDLSKIIIDGVRPKQKFIPFGKEIFI